jgi:hypothetical protein
MRFSLKGAGNGLSDPLLVIDGAYRLQHVCREVGQPPPPPRHRPGYQIWNRIRWLLVYLHYVKVPFVFNKYVAYGCLIGLWWSGIMVLYYTAIARGPLSVVIPIFNLNLVIPAILGFIFLNEAITVSKVLGLIFACLAVVLLAR